MQRDESGSIRALRSVEDAKFVSPYDVLNLLMGMNVLGDVPLDVQKHRYLTTAKLPKCRASLL